MRMSTPRIGQLLTDCCLLPGKFCGVFDESQNRYFWCFSDCFADNSVMARQSQNIGSIYFETHRIAASLALHHHRMPALDTCLTLDSKRHVQACSSAQLWKTDKFGQHKQLECRCAKCSLNHTSQLQWSPELL